MPRKRKHERIQCRYFGWTLHKRNGIYYADGRVNNVNAGRHSLETTDRSEALKALACLDQIQAERLGLAPATSRNHAPLTPLSLVQGRRLYEEHAALPRTAGGVRASTRKRYRTVFDKFLKFTAERGVSEWNSVDGRMVTAYVAYLERKGYMVRLQRKGYAAKTLKTELVTLIQAQHWLIESGYLPDVKPIAVKIRNVESKRPYCWRAEEVNAMLNCCKVRTDLRWLFHCLVALVHTGLRISEVASLRWSELDFATGMMKLTDESGRSGSENTRRELKTGRSRLFPIHQNLLEVFQEIQRHGDGYVFHGLRAGRLKPDTVRRVMIREVLEPLAKRFPSKDGGQSFIDGRLHSFRHYFCSACANAGIPEQMLMAWLGHKDSEMVRHYYHLHDEESRRKMNQMDFLGNFSGTSAEPEDDVEKGGAEPAA